MPQGIINLLGLLCRTDLILNSKQTSGCHKQLLIYYKVKMNGLCYKLKVFIFFSCFIFILQLNCDREHKNGMLRIILRLLSDWKIVGHFRFRIFKGKCTLVPLQYVCESTECANPDTTWAEVFTIKPPKEHGYFLQESNIQVDLMSSA